LRDFRCAAMAAGIFALASNSANASVLLADLDQISFSHPSFITSVGTITATDKPGGVDVEVVLNNGAEFVNSGGRKTSGIIG
jgi:hypothetical protein